MFLGHRMVHMLRLSKYWFIKIFLCFIFLIFVHVLISNIITNKNRPELRMDFQIN